MRRAVELACVLALLAACAPLAADGYQFPGVGARQLGRGGAVTSDVSDWTAIYWNPAGLARVRGRGQVGLHLLYSENEVEDGNSVANSFAGLDPTTPAAYSRDQEDLAAGFGSAGAVFRIREKNALAVGIYIPLLNGMDLSDTESGLTSAVSVDAETSLYLMYPTLAYARRLTERTLFGLGLSVVTAHLEFEQSERYVNPVPPMDLRIENSMDGDGIGIEATIGFQHRLSDRVSLGIVYRTGTTVDIKGDARSNVPVPPLMTQTVTTSDFDYEFVTPPAVAAGFAVGGERGIVLSVDWQRTFWEDFENGIDFDDPALPDMPNTASWRHADRLRTGLTWQARPGWTLAAGVFSYEWAVDRPDFLLVVDANQLMWTAGVSRNFERAALDFSFVQGGGERTESGVDYAIGGWQFNVGFTKEF
jgi:long-chain fatty acid transport protein